MEKRRPHYDLAKVKALILAEAYRVTRTALDTAYRDFGVTEPGEIAREVLAVAMRDFRKSMTTYSDSSLWQDVYGAIVRGVKAYVKVQIVSETTVIISFKEDTEE